MRIGKRRISVRLETAEGVAIDINSNGADIGNTQLEIDMSANMSVAPGGNSATIRIVNLSKSSRELIASKIQRKFDISAAAIAQGIDPAAIPGGSVAQRAVTRRGDCYAIISAGYDDVTPVIFEGAAPYSRHSKLGPTWYTELQIGDALTTMITGVAAKTFPPKTLLLDVVRYVVKSMGLDASVLKTPLQLTDAIGRGQTTFDYGFTAFGDSRWLLTAMLEPFGAEWFVDRGQFFVVRKGHALPEPAVVVDYSSGLRNHPEPTESGSVRIRSMFRSDIRIGRLVSVEGVDYAGVYRAETVMHRMNNRTGEAVTEAFLAPREGT